MDFRLSLLLVVCTLISLASSARLTWRSIVHQGGNLPPVVRWYAGSAVTQSDDGSSNTLYVFGGQGVSRDENNSTGVLGDTWMYEIDIAIGSGQWTEINPTMSPEPMFGFVGGLVGDLWIISHGCNLDTCFADTWAFNIVTQEWTQLINSNNHSGPIPSARRYTAGGVYPGQNELWLSMGESPSGRKLSDTWVLRVNTTDGITAMWEEVSPGGGLNQYNPFLPHARSLHAGAPVSSTSFAIFGGCASGGQVGGPCPLHDTWVFNLQDRKWEEITACPRPRTRHGMVTLPSISGSAVIVGGTQTYSPGIFPQPIFPENYNQTEIYLLYSVPRANYSSVWQRVLVEDGVAPPRLEGASITVSASGNIYMFGGRTFDDNLFQDDVWALSGDAADDSDEGCLSPLFTFVHLHGVLMYAAWGLFLPIGALLGRYYRWTWPCWFVLHVICQSMGVLLTVAGFVIVFLVGNFREPNFAHAVVGIILTAILIQQYLSGIFHPCVEKEDGKTSSDDKGVYRRCWEIYHGTSGFISIAIGFGQLTLGVFLVGAPLVVWAVWCGLGGLWILTFLLHEIAYVCTLIVNKVRD